MNPERWQRIKTVFDDALQHGPQERAASLDETCGDDDELRREVEVLLLSLAGAQSFMEQPAAVEVAELIVGAQARLTKGQRFAHYEILKPIGAGGMGEVYLAQDTKLNRKVAIKFIAPASRLDDQAHERLLREAQAAATLDHPYICGIHEIGEADGQPFIVMQYVEGETLAERLKQSSLKLHETIAIASQVADALAEAHAHGIVHRDIKPSNIIITPRGEVKVLDFGLAKKVIADGEDETQRYLSQPGLIIGTVAYMSPEQARGLQVDARTDIFSLGVLLYEMIAKRLPFEGSNTNEIVASLLGDKEPSPLARYAREVPTELERIVEKALRKDAEERYQTAKDMLLDLRRLKQQLEIDSEIERTFHPAQGGASGSAPPGKEGALVIAASVKQEMSGRAVPDSGAVRADEGFWIAVLPFKSRGGDGDLEAMAEGLSEEIVTGLSRFSYLRVIARSSTLRYAGESGDVRVIGKELGARYVLEGSLRRSGSELRLAVQLVDTGTGAHLWAETYHRPFSAEEIFALQDDLVPRIVCTVADLYGVLPRTMSESLRHRDPRRLSPYEAMLRAFGYQERLTVEEHAEVRFALERAVEESPDHADCWAMLSMTYMDEHSLGFNVQPDPLGRALAAARRAVVAAPTNHLAHSTLAQALFFRREMQAFRNAADRAIALNPMDAATTAFMGILIAYTGDWEHGCTLAEKAMQFNPNHPGWYLFGSFFNAYRKQHYRAALGIALKINMPGYFYTHAALAAAYGQLGEREAAQKALRELLAQKPDFAARAWEEYGKWLGPGKLLDHMLDGLRKAGLEIEAKTELGG